jgi:hypothetical protein
LVERGVEFAHGALREIETARIRAQAHCCRSQK